MQLPKRNVIIEKMRESIASVLPITLIVAALCLFLIPVSSGLMLSFLIWRMPFPLQKRTLPEFWSAIP